MSDKGDKSSSSTDSKNTSSTVRFDVGGTVYRVSRSLLAQYPDTMLSRMASEMWQNLGDEQLNEPLFIDRDGERFRYVLDYMRDGQQVSLPSTISKEGLLKDFEYCGFQDVNVDHISQPGPTFGQALKKINGMEDHLKNTHELASLTQYCVRRIIFSGKLFVLVGYSHQVGEFARPDLKHYESAESIKELREIVDSIGRNKDIRSHFDRCLESCGLRLTRVKRGEYPRLDFEFID